MDDIELSTNSSTAATTVKTQVIILYTVIGVLVVLLLISFAVIGILIRMLLKARKMRKLLRPNKDSEKQSLMDGHTRHTYGNQCNKELQVSDSLLSNPAYVSDTRYKIHDTKSISGDHYYSSVKDIGQHRQPVYVDTDPSSTNHSSVNVNENDAYGSVHGSIVASVATNSEGAYDYVSLPKGYRYVSLPGT